MAGASLFQVGHNVEFWRVLVHLSLLAACLLGFECVLHYVEHHLARYDKYYHMLQKVYRELMVLGLLSLVLKILKEVAPIDSESRPMLAFQVADLIIFGFALALVLQALCIFHQVRKHSRRVYQAELITTRDVVVELNKHDNNLLRAWPPKPTCCSHCSEKPALATKDIVRYRLLRHLFLRRFGLPQLFPFAKYMRRAQASQITHMIQVEPSMWLLVLLVAWGICGLATVLESVKLVKLLVIFAWSLVLIHCLVLLYLRTCVHQLLEVAGYSEDSHVLYANLASLAEEESGAWENETAEIALDAMHRVHEVQEESEHERKTTRRGFLQSDAGIQLVASLCGKLCGSSRSKRTSKKNQYESDPSRTSVCLRFFSSEAWHVVVILLLTLNGFFVALFVQCALYNLDEIYEALGLVVAVTVPLPMVVNTLLLQPFIFRDFTLVCSVLHLEASTLGDVTTHFIETIELQSQFAVSVLQCLKDGGLTIGYLETVVRSHDLKSSGIIEIDSLRAILASVGFSLTRFRFNSVVNLLFDLKRASVEYVQLFQLLALVQQDHEGSDGRSTFQEFPRGSASFEDKASTHSISAVDLSSIQHFAFTAQSSVAYDLANNDFAFLRTVSPTLRRVSTLGRRDQLLVSKDDNLMRRSMLQRSYTNQITGSSSRALHYMYNIRELARFQEDFKETTMV